MDLTEGTRVTPSTPLPRGLFTPRGNVTGHGIDEATGELVITVHWTGVTKGYTYDPSELDTDHTHHK
ncbi:hypothetical protein ACGFRG_05375 [Streptomyces sp. NPDC048696]|uniref:hypothetical protein n=1 Tax=Streptomyces sp. NPDC048696 TaxID=3365585 RepID=UPI00371B8759